MGACSFVLAFDRMLNVSAPSSIDSQRRLAWNSYWKSGVLHSCPTSFKGNYSGVIAQFWARAAAQLGPGARVLDLATGNGSIPRLLGQMTTNRIEIDAVDAADIAPAWSNGRAHVRFHPGVWMERLPFEGATFDAICSQFGIEYATRPDAWVEAARVLRPDGQVFLVLHHRHSVFAGIARDERNHLQWLLSDDGLLQAAVALAPWLVRMRCGEPVAAGMLEEANAARMSFNRTQAQMDARIGKGAAVDVLHEVRAHVHRILADSSQPEHALQEYRQRLAESLLRCSELVDSALDKEQVESLGSLLCSHGPHVVMRVEELRQDEGLLAWGLAITRA